MVLTINHNLLAANTSRNLVNHYSSLGKSVRRLSSGLRVGTAADDAAGLAVRELMRADIASNQQGLRNVNDAISMIQVADGALSVIDEKLIRMKELATQAATGTYNADQRLIINDEFQAMKREIQRISEATDFNGIKVINDDVLKFEMDPQQINTSGFGSAGNVEGSIVSFDGQLYAADNRSRVYIYDGGSTWTPIVPNADNRLSPTGGATGLKIIDGKLTAHSSDSATGGKIHQMDSNGNWVQLFDNGLTGDITNRGGIIEEFSGVTYVSASNTTDGCSLYRVNGEDLTLLAEDGFGDPNNYGLRFTNHNGTLYAGSSNNSGSVIKQYDGLADEWSDVDLPGFNSNDIRVRFSEVDGDLYVSTRNEIEGSKVYELTEFGWKTITLDGFGDPNNIAAEVYNVAGIPVISTRNDTTGGNFLSENGREWHETAQDGLGNANNLFFQFIETNGTEVYASSFNLTNGTEVFKLGEVTSTGPLIHFGAGNDSAEDYYSITSGDAGVSDSGLGIGNLNVASQTAAQYSLTAIDDAIIKKDKIRANLGATQNRLENTATNISIQAENLQAAESRISDVDVAIEMTEFTKEQILSQAATAMLAQANSMPRTILKLIEGG